MKSNIRVFKKNAIGARGNILPLSEFILCRDSKYREINSDAGEVLVKKALGMLDEELPLLPLSLYREFSLTEVRSNFERPHHRRRSMLFIMTLAEAYERRGRFIEKIADILWAVMEETSWVIPAHYYNSPIDPDTPIPEIYSEDQIPGLDLYAANTSAIVALARYLLSDELDKISPVICKRADHLVYLRAVRPYITVPFVWTGEIVNGWVNNWVTNISSSVLLAAALTTSDTELRERVVERAMRYLDNFTAEYTEDGFCEEGPGYWGAAGGDYFECLELIDDMSGGRIKLYGDPMVKRIGEYIASVNIDGDYYLNFADARPRLEQDGKLIMRYGEKCGSRELYSFGKMITAKRDLNEGYPFCLAYCVYKGLLMPEIDKADAVLGKRAQWFDGRKIAIFRESEDTSRGLYIAMKGGSNKESHNHNDVGCITVYSDGKPLIVDPSHGSYDNDYFGESRYKRWFMKSSYHSIPHVNGLEQLPGIDYASSDEACDLDKMTASMELKGAFPSDAGIASMRRTVALKAGEIAVTDSVKLEKDGDIQFNFVTVNEPKLISEGRLDIGEGRFFEYNPEGLELEIERVENKLLPYDDLNFKAIWDKECLWRICLKAHAKGKTVKITIK